MRRTRSLLRKFWKWKTKKKPIDSLKVSKPYVAANAALKLAVVETEEVDVELFCLDKVFF